MSCCSGGRYRGFGATINLDASGIVGSDQPWINGGGVNISADTETGMINIHGQVTNAPAKTGIAAALDQVLGWVKMNPALALGGAAATYLVLRKR